MICRASVVSTVWSWTGWAFICGGLIWRAAVPAGAATPVPQCAGTKLFFQFGCREGRSAVFPSAPACQSKCPVRLQVLIWSSTRPTPLAYADLAIHQFVPILLLRVAARLRRRLRVTKHHQQAMRRGAEFFGDAWKCVENKKGARILRKSSRDLGFTAQYECVFGQMVFVLTTLLSVLERTKRPE